MNWLITPYIPSYHIYYLKKVAWPYLSSKGRGSTSLSCLGGELGIFVKGLMTTTAHLLVTIYFVHSLCSKEIIQKPHSFRVLSSELRISDGYSVVSVSAVDVALKLEICELKRVL